MCGETRGDSATEVAPGQETKPGIGKGLAVFLVNPVGITPNDAIDLCTEGRFDLRLRVSVIGNETVVCSEHINVLEPPVLLCGVLVDKTDGG